ncbi:glycosyltransferase [Sphingomonas folli]|uniref:glycosyltransferase n=1 Tax=Sphingomonas folli TaxID=2862497 RepID=UPI0027E3DF1E|nr:glycosyltransferase [Sphingomonas folli]
MPPADPLLLDVGRLVWRSWAGRLPTGIDRVCHAYLDRYAGRAHGVIQWKGRRFVLPPGDTARLAALLAGDSADRRPRLAALLARALPRAVRAPRRGALYLNVGHTGLDDPGLVDWIARHELRAVHLIHDLIPLETPEYCRPGEASRHERRMRHALASASGIIGNSCATLDALDAFGAARGLPRPAAVAAWLAADALPCPATAPAPPDTPYFVAVGTIEGRKNHLLLLQLWRELARRLGGSAPRLVLVGQRGWEAADAMALLDRCAALAPLVEERGRCDDEALATLLTGARALLMPSFAEGYGMPVVEAMRLGVPVIASDLPVFREVAGTIPTYLSPLDAVAWERAVLDFAGESPTRERQRAALRGYRAPDWGTHFAAVEPWLAALPARR